MRTRKRMRWRGRIEDKEEKAKEWEGGGRLRGCSRIGGEDDYREGKGGGSNNI